MLFSSSASSSQKMSIYTYMARRHLARLKGAPNSQDLRDTRWTVERLISRLILTFVASKYFACLLVFWSLPMT